ncbi:MAG: hypothetical protein GY873_37715 [Bosea sp.]|uniref:hypothetical protein n=1 Tax=Bosea sp. (in: a-proteobacteria) TaxID=1871050 RepID=UPI00238C2451|nr:hypothetical protein [Bosea sp. (in: a-proteobacteria)]MCP4739941.1 hypothetical protein [Bosea sp. (in: a-proteobacteria)]
MLILVAALLAFHLVGYWAYRVGVESLASAQRGPSLAERIVSIKLPIAAFPTSQSETALRMTCRAPAWRCTGARSAWCSASRRPRNVRPP